MAGTHSMGWIRLPQEARTYVRSELRSGRCLARELLKLDLDSAGLWAYLPEATSKQELIDFHDGNIVPRTLGRAERLPGRRIARFLAGHGCAGQALVVFEDPYAKPDDAFIVEGRADTAVAFYEEDVLQILGPADRDRLEIELPVTEYPIIGVASCLPPHLQPPHNRDYVDRAWLVGLASHAVAVFVGAWNAETYIVCDFGLLSSARGDDLAVGNPARRRPATP